MPHIPPMRGERPRRPSVTHKHLRGAEPTLNAEVEATLLPPSIAVREIPSGLAAALGFGMFLVLLRP